MLRATLDSGVPSPAFYIFGNALASRLYRQLGFALVSDQAYRTGPAGDAQFILSLNEEGILSLLEKLVTWRSGQASEHGYQVFQVLEELLDLAKTEGNISL